MKICYLASSGSPHTKKWARAFADLGNEVHVISTRPVDIAGVSVHKIGCRHFKLMSDFFSLIQCRKILRSIQPDIVHAHFVTDYGLLGTLSNYHPLVISALGSDILIQAQNSPLWRCLTRYVFKKVDTITCTSNYLRDKAIKYTSTQSKIEVVPFGIDLACFQPKIRDSHGKSCKVIGTLKQLTSICGVEYLIKAVPSILKRQQNVKVLIAGGGDTKPYLALAERLQVNPSVNFLGALPEKAVPDYLNQLDIFVMPSLSESFGVAALEAQAMEVPVVASNLGGIPEVVKDGVTGQLVPPGNSEALADALSKLLESSTLRQQMGLAGRKFIIENYDLKNNTTQMAEIYNNTIREYQSRRGR